MVFKAIIKEVPKIGENRFLVRIPPLEDNTTKEFVLSALLCGQPGEYAGYEVGDVVFVEFEENKMDTPIILGKLYAKLDDSSRGYHKVKKLEVTDSINIPYNTNMGGYTVRDFFNLYQRVEMTLTNGMRFFIADERNDHIPVPDRYIN